MKEKITQKFPYLRFGNAVLHRNGVYDLLREKHHQKVKEHLKKIRKKLHYETDFMNDDVKHAEHTV